MAKEQEQTAPSSCCLILDVLYKQYKSENIHKDLDDLITVLVEYARLEPMSVEELPNRYYLIKTLRDFFESKNKA